MGANEDVLNFIDENMQSLSKSVLVLLDGYDEAVDGQCEQLDMILSTNGNDTPPLPFDLIVTRRETKVVDRSMNVTFLKIIGFDTKTKQYEYIAKHFANVPDKIKLMKSNIDLLDRSWYEQIAATPLLLTFLCLLTLLTNEKMQARLCEHVLFLMQRKLNKLPILLANRIATAVVSNLSTDELRCCFEDFFDEIYQLRRNLNRCVPVEMRLNVLARIEATLKINNIVDSNWQLFRSLLNEYQTDLSYRIDMIDLESGHRVYEQRLKGMKLFVCHILHSSTNVKNEDELKEMCDKVAELLKLLSTYPDNENYVSNSSPGSS